MPPLLTRGAHRKRTSTRGVVLGVIATTLLFTAVASATFELASSHPSSQSSGSRAAVGLNGPPAAPETIHPAPHYLNGSFPDLKPGALFSAQIQAENKLPGTSQWRITGRQVPGMISGFAQSTYGAPGDVVPLYISTPAATYTIEAFRMGWYQGLLARLVWTSTVQTGVLQPNCLMLKPSNTTECSNWAKSFDLTITSAFVPGDYLLKLLASNGGQQYIPLTVVDPNSNAAVAVINAVTDWQAYNNYGGYSLYHGPSFAYGSRATKVSFDRPYDFGFGFGSGDFLGNELPLVALVEKLGLNVTYVNSIYLQEHPQLVLNHNVMVSLGHDEYYSTVMRSALQDGVNNGRSLMFLGANAIFRRIRLDPSPLGVDRIEVNYRNPYQDPLFGKDNANVTANWPSFPDPSPESSLIGIQYACNPVNAPMRITDPGSWIFSGTGLGFGASIPHLIGSEFDQFNPYDPHPANVEILAHSPVLCGNRPYFSDMSYYSTPSGGGVFATGTNYWVATLAGGCPNFVGLCPDPATDRITTNVLLAFARGGVGNIHPSKANAMGVYYHPPIPALVPLPSPTTSTSSTTTSIDATTSSVPPTTSSSSVSPGTTGATSTSTTPPTTGSTSGTSSPTNVTTATTSSTIAPSTTNTSG